MGGIALEICVDAPGDVAVAVEAGADRIELCAALGLGGLTPGPGLLAAARAAGVPAHAMIRPRPGGFAPDEADLDACLADIRHMRAAGLAGVVVGAARGGALDVEALARMVEAAGPMTVTLHRVVDTLDDPVAAVGVAADLGVARVLTSGGAPTAAEGLPAIARMARAAGGRVEVMAGGGVTPASAGALVAAGAVALHASCARPVPGSGVLGLPAARRTDPAAVRALGAALSVAVAA